MLKHYFIISQIWYISLKWFMDIYELKALLAYCLSDIVSDALCDSILHGYLLRYLFSDIQKSINNNIIFMHVDILVFCELLHLNL